MCFCSSDADPSAEDSWKFCYVYKGPQQARQKKLYYVFGKGLKTNEQGMNSLVLKSVVNIPIYFCLAYHVWT